MNEKARENSIRRMAQKLGFTVRKSRKRVHYPYLDDWGDYLLVDNETNGAIIGSRFDASLDEIENYLIDYAEILKSANERD